MGQPQTKPYFKINPNPNNSYPKPHKITDKQARNIAGHNHQHSFKITANTRNIDTTENVEKKNE